MVGLSWHIIPDESSVMETKAQKLSKLFQIIGDRNSLTTVKFLVFDIKPLGVTI